MTEKKAKLVKAADRVMEAGWRFWETRCGVVRLWREGEQKTLEESVRGEPGVYVQARRGHCFYVGQSVDVAQRQQQHVENSVDVVALGVLRMPGAQPAELQAKETDLIAAGLAAGLPLANLDKITKAREELMAADLAATVAEGFTPANLSRFLADFWGPDGLVSARRRLTEDRTTALKEKEAAIAALRKDECFYRLLWLAARLMAALPGRWRHYGRRWALEVHRPAAAPALSQPQGAPLLALRTGVESLLAVRKQCRGGVCELRATLRLASGALVARWGRIEAAQFALGGAHWRVEEGDDLARRYAEVLKASRRDPARRQDALCAGAGLACGWAAGGPAVAVTDRLDVIEALLERDEVFLAAQLQAIADMACLLPPLSDGFRAPWLL